MWKFLGDLGDYALKHYGQLLVGLFSGYILCLLYHRLIGIRELKESYKMTIRALEDQNLSLKRIVHERLAKITPAQQDARFFKRLKGFFGKRK